MKYGADHYNCSLSKGENARNRRVARSQERRVGKAAARGFDFADMQDEAYDMLADDVATGTNYSQWADYEDYDYDWQEHCYDPDADAYWDAVYAAEHAADAARDLDSVPMIPYEEYEFIERKFI